MNKSRIVIALFTVLIGFVVVALVSSCDRNEESIVDSRDGDPSVGSLKVKQTSGKLLKEFEASPKFGTPRKTNYLFRITGEVSASEFLWVKLYNKTTGTITYHQMFSFGFREYRLYLQISDNAVYDYRYMKGPTFNRENLSHSSYRLWNSSNTFHHYASIHLSWPFGADGSSYHNRLGWIGSMEHGGCGYGHNQGGHINQGWRADDRYAEDWNKNCGTNNDDGAEFRSPLDGKVIRAEVDKPSNHHGGYGNFVDVEQETSVGIFVFRVAHLKYPPSVRVGQWVQAGKTKLGNIGMSGGKSSSPHAHVALYLNNGGRYEGKVFSFAPLPR